MRSMTGFGQAKAEGENVRVQVTARAVNHRFLDLVLRLRDEERAWESELREIFGAELHRGRVEVGLEIEVLTPLGAEVAVDDAVIRNLHHLCHELAQKGLIASEITLGDLLALPGVVQVMRPELPEWSDGDRRALARAAAETRDQLVAARRLEGAKLRAVLEERVAELEALQRRLEERAAGQPEELKTALEARLAELVETRAVDPERLAQEVAILVDKSDVREELDRLGSHLEHLRSLFDEAGSLGKRLDFLCQEIFRELNTLAAKCRDAEMTRWVLDGKVCCEQMREQIQNVE